MRRSFVAPLFLVAVSLALAATSACGSFSSSPAPDAGTDAAPSPVLDGAADSPPGADASLSPPVCDSFDRTDPVGGLWMNTVGVKPTIANRQLTTTLQSSPPNPSLLRSTARSFAGDVEVSMVLQADVPFTGSFTGEVVLLEIDASPDTGDQQEVVGIGVKEHELFVEYRAYPTGNVDRSTIPGISIEELAQRRVKLTLRAHFAPKGRVVVLVDDTVTVDLQRPIARTILPTSFKVTIGPEPSGPTPMLTCNFDDVCVSP